MADKKTATKTTVKKAEKVDVSKLPLDQQLAVRRNDLLTLRKSLYDGTLQNPHAIKAARKDVAKILTQINQEKEKK